MKAIIKNLWADQIVRNAVYTAIAIIAICVIAYNGQWEQTKYNSPKAELFDYIMRGIKTALKAVF